MNCQHVCKYPFPKVIFNIFSHLGTLALDESVSNATRLFNMMNMHMRLSASAGGRKNIVCYASEACSDDYSGKTTCL